MKLETEILLNRFRCNAELARLADFGNQQEAREDDRTGRPDNRESVEQKKLEEIERRVAETLERHRALYAHNR